MSNEKWFWEVQIYCSLIINWSQWPGLNRRPTVYETVALPLSYIGLSCVTDVVGRRRPASWHPVCVRKRNARSPLGQAPELYSGSDCVGQGQEDQGRRISRSNLQQFRARALLRAL